MKAPRESEIVSACLQLLKMRGVLAWRANQVPVPLKKGGFRRFAGLKGVSDILGILSPGGQFLAVEVKRPGGRLRKEQAWFLNAVEKAGGIALCVHSVDELDQDLKAIGIGG